MCCRRAGGEFFAHNQVNDIAQAGVGHPSVGDVGTFIHHHDPVADQEQVLQAVGNQNHAHPASGNAANELQNRFNFRDGQRGGGFIHNQHFRVKGRGAGDGYSLALAAGEISHQQPGIRNGDPEPFKHLSGIGVHFGLVEIENYIQQGVKGILVAAIDVNGIMPAVKEAAAANIPVIAIDAVLPAGPQAAQVGVDNIEGGRIIGQYFVDYVQKEMGGQARLGIVGALNSAIQNQRQKGFEETLKSNPKITIANVVDGQNVQDKAMTAAENLITGNPDLTAIYATGEPALLGAIAAVENQGRQKDIKVFGWDLTAKAISGIDGGYVTAVLQQDPEKMGAEALNALNSITSGKTVPKTILVPATVVTKANVDSYRPLFK